MNWFHPGFIDTLGWTEENSKASTKNHQRGAPIRLSWDEAGRPKMILYFLMSNCAKGDRVRGWAWRYYYKSREAYQACLTG